MLENEMKVNFYRGDICRFETNEGLSLGMVISNDRGNHFSQILMVAQVIVGKPTKKSHLEFGPYTICFEKIFTYDKSRYVKKVAKIDVDFDEYLQYTSNPNIKEESSTKEVSVSVSSFKELKKGLNMLFSQPKVQWGELYFVHTNKNPKGKEQAGERLVVVISNNEINAKGEGVLVLPGTKQKKNELPTHFSIPAGIYGTYPNDTTFMGEQSTFVDSKEFEGKEPVGRLPLSEFGHIVPAVFEVATAKDVRQKLIEKGLFKEMVKNA